MDVWIDVWMDICMSVRMNVCVYVCMSVRMNVCVYVCISVCMCVCMSVCMNVCLYAYICVCEYGVVTCATIMAQCAHLIPSRTRLCTITIATHVCLSCVYTHTFPRVSYSVFVYVKDSLVPIFMVFGT